jgi:hypothetical protein
MVRIGQGFPSGGISHAALGEMGGEVSDSSKRRIRSEAKTSRAKNSPFPVMLVQTIRYILPRPSLGSINNAEN